MRFFGSGWVVACAAGLVTFEATAVPTSQLPPAPPPAVAPVAPKPKAGPPPTPAPAPIPPAPKPAPTDAETAPPAPETTPPPAEAPAPQPSTPVPPPPPKPYPQGYPPPGYPPYGYPPQGYGQPGYPGYPPPYGYPPGYYQYPPRRQREPVARYPDDAAAETSPFIEMLIGGQAFSQRFSSFFNVGLQLGVFIGGRLRLAGRVLMFPADPDDNYTSGSSFNDDLLGAGYFPTESEPAAFLFGGSAGVVLASTANFVLAPGVVFLSNDQADDYGSFVGVGIPFDWVTDSGLRVGFEVTIGRAFGGSVLGTCQNNFGGSPPPAGACDVGQVNAFDREAGAGFYSHFHLGWGFNRPKPRY